MNRLRIYFLFFSIFCLSSSLFAQGDFAPKIDYGTGGAPYSIFASDLDGDGDQDLAVANNGYLVNTVSVLKNNGDGTFAAKIDYGTGRDPHSVFASDLDGDTDKDLAVANFNSYTVSVFKNNGDGTFAAKVDYATGSAPISVFAADLDGDGDRDLAVANVISNTVSILKNNGNGTFATKVDYGTGIFPVSVYVSDLDGDGDQDLVTTNNYYLANTVSFLKNNGDGTFAAKVDYGTGFGPYSVFASDLDGDADNDLAVANGGSNTVSVLKNNGDGTFAAKVDYATVGGPVSVFASDLDGDTDNDLVVANINSATVSVLKNNGDGTFAAKVDYGTGLGPRSVFASDLDGDGDQDLITANEFSNTVSVLKNMHFQCPSLSVPKYLQTVLPWGPNEYDKAHNWAPPQPITIARWGCVITDLVMILRYYGITEDVDNKDVNPDNINTWFTNHGGYDCNGNVRWPAVLSYSGNKVKYDGGLDCKKVQNCSNASKTQMKMILDTELNNGRPVIVKELWKGKPWHFLLATCKTGSTWSINDPLVSSNIDLAAYGNDIYGIRKFSMVTGKTKPLILTICSPAELIVTDPLGRKVGYNPEGDSILQEIPDGSYSYDQIAAGTDPDSTGSDTSTELSKSIFIDNPVEGRYDVGLIGTGTGDYSLELFTYNPDDTLGPYTEIFSGSIDSAAVKKYSLEFSDTATIPAALFECLTIAGDANADSKVNLQDIIYKVNYIFKGGPTPSPLCRGDSNADGKVNLSDIIYVVNYIFKGGSAPIKSGVCCL